EPARGAAGSSPPRGARARPVAEAAALAAPRPRGLHREHVCLARAGALRRSADLATAARARARALPRERPLPLVVPGRWPRGAPGARRVRGGRDARLVGARARARARVDLVL